VSRGPDYWDGEKMTPRSAWATMATWTRGAGAWAGVGRDQLQWLNQTLSSWDKAKPIVIFSHNPLTILPALELWVRDWREVQEVLRPFSNVTNIHGHTPPGALPRARQDALHRNARHLLAMAYAPKAFRR